MPRESATCVNIRKPRQEGCSSRAPLSQRRRRNSPCDPLLVVHPSKRYREPWYKLVVTEETKFSREVIGCYSCEKHLRLSQVRQLSRFRKPSFSGLPTAALRPYPVTSISAPAATARLKSTDRIPAGLHSRTNLNGTTPRSGDAHACPRAPPKARHKTPLPLCAAESATAPLSLDYTSSHRLHLTYF